MARLCPGSFPHLTNVVITSESHVAEGHVSEHAQWHSDLVAEDFTWACVNFTRTMTGAKAKELIGQFVKMVKGKKKNEEAAK